MLNDTISSNAILGIVIILIGNTLAVVYQRKSSKIISYRESIDLYCTP
jgi:hypothetical protein